MREVKVATAQFETTLDPEKNRKKVLRYCEEAARKGAQAIVFAEFWMTGNPTTGDNSRLVKLVEPVQALLSSYLRRRRRNSVIHYPRNNH